MAEPQSYEPEKLTSGVTVMDLKETETEENYVRRLATGLCTVWNNNPAAFKWWRKQTLFPSKCQRFFQPNNTEF